MRAVLLLLSLVALTGCSLIRVGDAGDRECVNSGPPRAAAPAVAAAPIPQPNLLSRTIEERVAGTVGVAMIRLESVSYDLPDRAANNRINLGTVNFEFTVLESLKTRRHVPERTLAYMGVGYACEYMENDERDREALAELSADLEEFFGDRELIVFLPHYGGFHMTGATITFRDKSIPAPPPVYGVDPLEQEYGLWRGWNDGSQWLLRAEGVGSDQDPHFVDPLDAPYRMDVPENTISLSEVRERVNAVIAEEEERGVECVGAQYKYQWYVRSNEESWYRGRVGSDGTPIECIEI